MATIDMKATGANIRAYIKNNKMKIAEVQAIFGFNTPQAIYKWMRGDAIPTIDNIVILADIFGVGIGDIVVVSRKCALAAGRSTRLTCPVLYRRGHQ